MKFLFTYQEKDDREYFSFRDEEISSYYSGEKDKKSDVLQLKDNTGLVTGIIDCDFSLLKKECVISSGGKKLMTLIKKPGINARRFSLEGTLLEVDETSWNYSYKILKGQDVLFTCVFKDNRGMTEIMDTQYKDLALLITASLFMIIK